MKWLMILSVLGFYSPAMAYNFQNKDRVDNIKCGAMEQDQPAPGVQTADAVQHTTDGTVGKK